MKKLLLLLVFAVSCSPSSMKDLRAEAEAETAKLVHILREVESKDQLQRNLPKVKKRFDKIAQLALVVRDVQDKSGASLEPSNAGDDLFVELARLYEMPGCRDLLEAAQCDAASKLSD